MSAPVEEPATAAAPAAAAAPVVFAPASADSPGRFGLELTFTNEKLIEMARDENGEEYRPYFEATLTALIETIAKADPDATVVRSPDEHQYTQATVTLPSLDGLQLFIHSDDWVFEVGSSPLETGTLGKNVDHFQRVLFGSMEAVGLRPHPRVGGGHLHLEYASHFRGANGGFDTLLMRNFIVDISNRPLLFLGGLSRDLLNAPPLAVLPAEQQVAFTHVVADFDALAVGDRSVENLKKEINDRVYLKSYIQRDHAELQSYNKKQRKYHVINLLHVHTLEMRGLRPEASAHSLLALMQLFEGRLAALRALSEPLVYHSQNLAHLVSWSVHRHMEEYKVDIADADIEQAVRAYVVDAGMDVSTFPFEQVMSLSK